MPNRTSLNVSLTPELEQFVQSRLASGRYQTASEVVREQARAIALKELRAKIRRRPARPRRVAGCVLSASLRDGG
jgi:antitoxin ParD1/3/4